VDIKEKIPPFAKGRKRCDQRTTMISQNLGQKKGEREKIERVLYQYGTGFNKHSLFTTL
jgi:hypothetical protein